ncbi:MAG TPA: VCBS repeat-containing protein, partial [Bacteroidales bacterium]|nr:VCBS repeat-containing protein [Bacteroidales bacterium]
AIESVNLTDWDSDGTVDMIAKSKSGILYLFKGYATGGFVRSTIGLSGWQDYDIEVAKWKKSDTKPSIIAKHKVTGDIYAYSNPTGTNPVNPVKIGSKFTGYALDILDFDKDGNMDMVIRSSATGSMYLYRTSGNGSFYSETRKVIGTGWKDFNSVTTVRNFQGSNTDGLLARDANGALFYFKTNTGSFASRIQVGTGWTAYRISNN